MAKRGDGLSSTIRSVFLACCGNCHPVFRKNTKFDIDHGAGNDRGWVQVLRRRERSTSEISTGTRRNFSGQLTKTVMQ